MNTMDRRTCLKHISAGAGCLFLSDQIILQKTHATDNLNQKPNIVMIISDDQGWGDYGFMGHDTIETPCLDRLASQSVVFSRGYVAAPLCCPSLASILTGLHPHQHKITSNDPPSQGSGNQYNPKNWSTKRQQLRQEMIGHFQKVPNLATMLNQAGYRSLQTGKWWMGSYKQGGFTHGMTHGDIDKGGRHGDEGLVIGREGLQPVYDFIDEDPQAPFFVWYAPLLPHTPHTPPGRLLEKYQKKTDSIHIARYQAMCEWFDETCGELMKYLDEKGLSQNTIIIYICDNGWIQHPDRNAYADQSKRSPYEGGIRTPIMVRWPGKAEPRMDTESLASAIDLAPTILHACSLQPTLEMQGLNLLDQSALANRNTVCGAAYTHDAVDIDKPESSLRYSYIIEGDWKLIIPSGRNDTTGKPELYNLKNDPHETQDLSHDHSQKVAHLKDRLKNWWKDSVPEKTI